MRLFYFRHNISSGRITLEKELSRSRTPRIWHKNNRMKARAANQTQEI